MSSNPRRFLPPLSALLAFEHAGVQLSFKRAASSLALSPSAVSHQIRNLEDRLGVQLFARREGATRLTAAGERYLEAVSAALKTIESATSAILQERRDFRSELKVSAPPLFTSTVLMPALGDLEAFGVFAKLHLESFRGQGDFESSGVDIAIRLGREQCVGLRLHPLLETHRLPVCAPSLAHGCQSLMDLERQALIHVETQPHAWSRWLADMGEPGLRGARDVWVDSEPAALEAAEHGLGFALALDPLIRCRKDFGRSLTAPIKVSSEPSESFYMVCRPERADDKPIEAFRAWLAHAVRRLGPRMEAANVA